MWDERYSTDDYVYGTEPNDFLRAHYQKLPPGGAILCLAEGEGRNAVFLARQGFSVTAVDSSSVGLEKARALAARHTVKITTVTADLADYEIANNTYDGIISIFCHTPPPVRSRLNQQIISGLKQDGLLILEGYTPDQLGRGTGGPPSEEMMHELATLQDELAALDFLYGKELLREVHEGSLHNGMGAVVQAIARK